MQKKTGRINIVKINTVTKRQANQTRDRHAGKELS